MNRHLKKVPQSFESGPGQPAESADPAAATEPDAEVPPRESGG